MPQFALFNCYASVVVRVDCRNMLYLVQSFRRSQSFLKNWILIYSVIGSFTSTFTINIY